MRNIVLRGWYFGKRVYLHFQQTGASHRSAALAFTTLLSLVPLMTVSLAIFSAFPAFKTFSSRIQDFVFNNFVVSTGDVVQNYLQTFIAKAGQLSVFGLIFLVVTAIVMMFTMEETFNAIWRVHKRRHWLQALMLYWTILTLSPLLLGVSFVASSYLTSFAEFLGLYKILLIVTPFLLSIAAFMLLYIAVPHYRVPIKSGFIGALFAAVLFELSKHLFALYIIHFAGYQLLYGTLATIPIFLLWIYLCWFITLLGAVVSFVIAEPR